MLWSDGGSAPLYDVRGDVWVLTLCLVDTWHLATLTVYCQHYVNHVTVTENKYWTIEVYSFFYPIGWEDKDWGTVFRVNFKVFFPSGSKYKAPYY